MAYLRGLFDGMQQAKIVEDMKSTFCPLATPDLDQIRLIIEQWVRDNLSHSRADSDIGVASASTCCRGRWMKDNGVRQLKEVREELARTRKKTEKVEAVPPDIRQGYPEDPPAL